MASASKELKRRHKKSLQKCSLKQFVRKLLKESDGVAAEWFLHKSPEWNKEAKEMREINKGARIKLEKSATKSARRKVKGGGKSTT